MLMIYVSGDVSILVLVDLAREFMMTFRALLYISVSILFLVDLACESALSQIGWMEMFMIQSLF